MVQIILFWIYYFLIATSIVVCIFFVDIYFTFLPSKQSTSPLSFLHSRLFVHSLRIHQRRSGILIRPRRCRLPLCCWCHVRTVVRFMFRIERIYFYNVVNFFSKYSFRSCKQLFFDVKRKKYIL